MTRATRRLAAVPGLIALCGTLSACGASSPDDSPDAERSIDAGIDCRAMPSLTLGWCRDTATNAPCTGLDTAIEMVPLSGGEALMPVIGPQGSAMWVLALETTGIFPGDGGLQNPTVRLLVRDPDDLEVASYQSNPDFVASSGGAVIAPSLYVVLYYPPEDLAGLTLTAHAEIRDRDGAYRCAELDFDALPLAP